MRRKTSLTLDESTITAARALSLEDRAVLAAFADADRLLDLDT
jgi:hypothetical protein